MITSDEFKLFTTLIHEKAGICLKDTQRAFVESRIRRRMDETGIATPYRYYRMVLEREDTELIRLIDELTIHETSFFRNMPQMDLFKLMILPELITRKKRSCRKMLSIWSAGCSTGEEPYTIAMIIEEFFQYLPDRYDWDIRIYASDISLRALESAVRGEYEREKVDDTVDVRYISKYFDNSPSGYSIRNVIKKYVIFDFHNLKNNNGLTGLDVVFCRNVMIYFDQDEQGRLINTLIGGLNGGGYLFVGHAETLQGLNTGMKFVYDNGGAAYKKADLETAENVCAGDL